MGQGPDGGQLNRVSHPGFPVDKAQVLLHWLPLGAGARSVAWNGRTFEAVAARYQHRAPCDLYHSALVVWVGGARFTIEMAPAWAGPAGERGVVREGPVGSSMLGHSRLFRYEVRCWRDGVVPDIAAAVGGPRLVGVDPVAARHLITLTRCVPRLTWGRDERRVGEMWNSNSVTSWLLARSGHDLTALGRVSETVGVGSARLGR
jgi:hypothetical protein